jgi:hypothetical protein
MFLYFFRHLLGAFALKKRVGRVGRLVYAVVRGRRRMRGLCECADNGLDGGERGKMQV